MPFNHKLKDSLSYEDLFEMGFVENEDGTGDPRGTTYDFKNSKFWISIDAWFEVSLSRLNPDTDEIKVQIESKFELGRLQDFISDDTE